MAYTVFFREAKEIFTADNFILQQPGSHRELLQTLVDELATKGHIAHPLVTKTSSGDWSVLIKEDNGDVYTYSVFISRLEQQEKIKERNEEKPKVARRLVIIDPAGSRDSIGGYHPGYWSVEQYASFLEEAQRKLFLKTIEHIENNIRSDYYSVNNDGSISIHIDQHEKAYAISVSCRAEWK